MFCHVLNRANARARIFAKPADYEAFERVFAETLRRHPMRILAHRLMPKRCVEQNLLRAKLSRPAQSWRWGSLGRRTRGGGEARWLHPWPGGVPDDWLERVNRPDAIAEREETRAIRERGARGRPYGAASWSARTAKALGLEAALRPRGRPRKDAAESGVKGA